MTYQEVLSSLFARGRFGMRPGLERIERLLARLGDPQRAVPAIHVAGTNGKGSTAAMLGAILEAAGITTGLFTSPHLIHYTERFRLQGEDIRPAELVPLAERVLAAAPAEATFFELTAALAWLYFAEAGAQLAVLEVGMGGRFDATNAAHGLLAVVTPVALDHTAYLGESLAAIAGEKAGVFRPGRPVVVGRQQPEALAVLAAQGQALASPLFRLGTEFTIASAAHGDGTYTGLDGEQLALRPGLTGPHQWENAACAAAAAQLLALQGWPVTPAAIRSGLAQVRWPGRLEEFPGAPRLLLDGAHNPAGGAALRDALEGFRYRRLFLVVGLLDDKDWAGTLAPLLPMADEVVAVAPALPRALPVAELASHLAAEGLAVQTAESVAAGLALARTLAAADDLVVVCGSLFTVGEARAALLATSPEMIRG